MIRGDVSHGTGLLIVCLAVNLGVPPAGSFGQVKVTSARIMLGDFVDGWFRTQEEVREVQPGQLFTVRLEATNLDTVTWHVLNLCTWQWSGNAQINRVGNPSACAFPYNLEPGASCLVSPFCDSYAFQAISPGPAILDVVIRDWYFTPIGGGTLYLRIGHGPQADLDCDSDVDADDFMRFESCATGPALPYDPHDLMPGCAEVPNGSDRIAPDLDNDGDVDGTDFGIFQRCYSGEGNPADPNCAD